jgi:hypothetical protein
MTHWAAAAWLCCTIDGLLHSHQWQLRFYSENPAPSLASTTAWYEAQEEPLLIMI